MYVTTKKVQVVLCSLRRGSQTQKLRVALDVKLSFDSDTATIITYWHTTDEQYFWTVVPT